MPQNEAFFSKIEVEYLAIRTLSLLVVCLLETQASTQQSLFLTTYRVGADLKLTPGGAAKKLD